VQVDAHTHILSLAEDAEFTTEYGREGSLCIYRSAGKLPAHRLPTEEEWEASGFSRKGFPVIGVPETLAAHPGFDKIVILAVSPQFLDGELIGTVDSYGITDVPGPATPEKCNDYIAALQRQDPGTIVGYASVNPNYCGPKAAVRELDRAVNELGLQGVKLYPMYQDWSPADPVIAFPVFEKAEELGIPVMVHQAGSTRIDARMEYARPALLDAAGRHFRSMKLTIAHLGLPWVDEALFMLTKHPNFFGELSYYIATCTGEELYRFLVHAEQFFVPLEKLFFGTDYPGFLYDPVKLRAKLLAVNEHAERLGTDPVPQAKLDGIMGDNFARMMGWLP
jgi:predicted TIM-barrel fold metal-dependent hydrolase